MDAKTIEAYVREGLKEQVDKIVTEEAEAASKRVVDCVMALKTGAAEKILTHMKISRIDDPSRMAVQIIFDV